MAEAELQYVVERSSRRTLGIYVERDGTVLVRAPAAASNERIAAAVRSKLAWVYRARARWRALNPPAPRKEFVPGETVYFMGEPHRLDFRDDCRDLARVGDTFVMPARERAGAEDLLKDYYRREGLERLPPIAAPHASSMGVRPRGLRVLELGHRWASCSAAGTLNFHWKALAVPLEVLHYLVVHELAHLVHRNHTNRFWAVVEAELPGWRRHASWLDQHGARMTL